MSRPSYRSVLALMLFGFTEMPVDTDDHGLNQLCSDALFSHLNYLRSPLQSRASRPLCDFNTVLPPNPGQASVPTPELMDDGRESQKHMRGNVFWLGVIVDTTRSLLQQRPSILLPGRSGDEKVWNFIRQRTIIFDQSFRSLHGSPLPLTRDVTTTVLQHASACKTMYLGMMNQFFDAVLNYPPEFVEDAAERVVVESRRFHNAFDQLLAMCARDYMTMSGLSQLNYSESKSYPLAVSTTNCNSPRCDTLSPGVTCPCRFPREPTYCSGAAERAYYVTGICLQRHHQRHISRLESRQVHGRPVLLRKYTVA